MNDTSPRNEAIELFQQLGLKEYEAKSFVALTRRRQGTAKDISESSEVPRTRVYDAIRVLESKGLVETQHSNPQVFRAVSIDEAVTTLRNEYEERTDALRQALQQLDQVDEEAEADVTHEVWTLSGDKGISSRTHQLIADAEEELIIVVGHEGVFTDQLAADLTRAEERGVDVYIGTISDELQTAIKDVLPGIEVFVSGLEWLSHSSLTGDDTEISRLVLADREAILVSSFTHAAGGEREHEQGVFGRGFDNGLVAIVRRLMATGLQSAEAMSYDG